MSCWLQIAPQRRIERQMTSRIPPPRGACSNLAGLYCSYHAYGVLHCHAICLDYACFVWMPPVCFLYQICELCNAMFFSQLSYMWIMHLHGARHHICELSHAIFFFITYSICRQSVYIELLFMCISHLSRLWKNLEWKQGLQSRQWYLLKHISRWLQGAPQRRIQRQMTSPISHLRCML